MNRLRSFLYVLKQSFSGIVRNGFMIFASVCVVFVSLFIVGSLVLTSMNLQNILDIQSERPEVTVDCEVAVTDEASLQIEQIIKSDGRVRSVYRVSKQENLERMLALFESHPDLFEDYLQENPDFMNVTFEVELKKTEDAEAFKEAMLKVAGVDKVTHTLSIYQFFKSIKFWVQTGSYVAIGVLGFLSVLLTINTIRLTVFARKKELNIMKYIGASYGFIQGPFILEGLFIGVAAALLSFLATKGAYRFISDYIAGKSDALREYIVIRAFDGISGTVMTAFLIAGAAVGILSSLLAIKKYLRREG